MQHYVIKDLKSKEMAPGVTLRSVYLKNAMVTFVDLADGAVVPPHSHPHEQISVVISGKLRFMVDGEEKMVSAGETVVVPANAKHGVVTVGGPAVAYDSWSPIREDYIIP